MYWIIVPASRFQEERGISPIVSAVLVIVVVIISLSVYLREIVPQHQRRNEAEHMREVRSAFMELQGMILGRENGEVEVPMSPKPTPLFTLTPKSNRIEVVPARWVKRIMPTDDAYVDQENGNENYGITDNGLLSVRSYTSKNRRVYLKFDIGSELPDIGSHDIVEAWLVLYCENISKFMVPPWEMDEYDPLDNDLEMDLFYLPDLPLKVEVRRVENNDWSEDNINWENQPGFGDTIKAMAWPNEDNQTIKMGEVWYTWEVTSWVKDRVEAGENISFCLKAPYEDSSLERYAYFTSSEGTARAVANVPGVSDLDNDGVIDENEIEGDERKDKVTGHPPYPKPHLTVFYENGDDPGPPILDNRDDPYGRWGAFVEGGHVRFDAQYYRFPEHSFILEDGAIFQQQYGFAYEFMISDPGLVVGEHIEDDPSNAIAVILNRYRIVNWDRISTSSDVKLRVRVTENREYWIEPDKDADGNLIPNRENLVITLRSEFEWPWKRYLRDLTGRWNQSARKGGLQWWVNDYYYDTEDGDWSLWSNNITDPMVVKQVIGRNLRLYIWGRIEDPAVKDIYYFDRTYDVEVTIVV
jgi:flagellin-like protein